MSNSRVDDLCNGCLKCENCRSVNTKTVQPTSEKNGAVYEICECGEKKVLKILYAYGSGTSTLLGDVNIDTLVNADDLTALARHVAKIEIITDSKKLKNADVNISNSVNADDLTRLARHIAKIESL